MKKNLLIKLVVTCLIITTIIVFFDINFSKSISSITSPFYIYLALLIPLIINPIISNNRWQIFLKVQGINEKILQLVKISFSSLFLGLVLPATSGSDAIRIYQIEKRHKGMQGAGGASVLIERLLGFLILSLLGVVGAVIAMFYNVSFYIFLIILLIHLLIWCIFIIIKNKYLYIKITGLLLKTKRLKKIVAYLNLTYIALHTFPLRKVLLKTIPLILAFQFFTIICGFLIFIAFGINLPFYYHLAFFPLIQIISIIPVSLSGLGLREGGFVYFYGLLGIDSNISFLVSLLYFGVLVLVPAAIGMVLYLTGSTDIRKEK
jgi:glycosyltransferase 2 family protein